MLKYQEFVKENIKNFYHSDKNYLIASEDEKWIGKIISHGEHNEYGEYGYLGTVIILLPSTALNNDTLKNVTLNKSPEGLVDVFNTSSGPSDFRHVYAFFQEKTKYLKANDEWIKDIKFTPFYGFKEATNKDIKLKILTYNVGSMRDDGNEDEYLNL